MTKVLFVQVAERVSLIISVVVTSFTHPVAKHNRLWSFLMICPEELLFLMAINQN